MQGFILWRRFMKRLAWIIAHIQQTIECGGIFLIAAVLPSTATPTLVFVLCCTVPVYNLLCIQNKLVLPQLLSLLLVHSGDPKFVKVVSFLPNTHTRTTHSTTGLAATDPFCRCFLMLLRLTMLCVQLEAYKKFPIFPQMEKVQSDLNFAKNCKKNALPAR